MTLNERTKNRLIEANRLLIKVRWFYVTALALTGVISKIAGGESANVNFSGFFMAMFGVLVYGYNIYFYIFLRNPRNHTDKKVRTVSYLNVTFDQVCITGVIFFAGGISSISFLYYLYAITASAFFFSFVGVFWVATFSALLYSSLIFFQFIGLLPYFPRYDFEYELILANNPASIYTNIFAVVSSFYIVGYFAGLMSKLLTSKEKEVVAEKDKSEAIISNLAEGLIFVDAENHMNYINVQAERLLEIDAKELIGQNIKRIDFNKYKILKQVFDCKSEKETIKLSNKSDISYRIYSFDIRTEDNGLVGSAKLIRDISRAKFVEKMKSEFITIAGHQLRTPLSAIKNAIDLLRSGDYGEVNKGQKKILDQSFDYTENLIGIVNDMLDVSSIEEGRYDYQFEKADLHNLLREVAERFYALAEKKDIKFSFNMRNNLFQLELDFYKMKLALGAVVDNAFSYSRSGGEVRIDCFFDNEGAIIEVRDNGIGIPEKSQEKIFTKFYRAQNALRHLTEGNGLDLFVAKNIINRHGGRIWFESKVDKGSRFFIKLPLKQDKK